MSLTISDIEALADEYESAERGVPDDISHLCESFAEWNRRRATAIARVIRVENTENEVPYQDAASLFRGVEETGKFLVPTTFWIDPAYDEETNIALRICHDVDGHLSSRRGFAWEDECVAYATQALVTPQVFIPLIFSEILHQLSYTVTRRQFPTVQKPFLTERQDLVWKLAEQPFQKVAGMVSGHLVRCSEPTCFSIAGECKSHDQNYSQVPTWEGADWHNERRNYDDLG